MREEAAASPKGGARKNQSQHSARQLPDLHGFFHHSHRSRLWTASLDRRDSEQASGAQRTHNAEAAKGYSDIDRDHLPGEDLLDF